MIGLFLQMGESYKRIKKSTTLDIAFNSETETYDFIADKNPTESLKNYSPQISQDLTMIKGEDDFEYIPFGARRKKSDNPKQVIKDEYVENAVFSVEGEAELDFLDD